VKILTLRSVSESALNRLNCIIAVMNKKCLPL